jgi:predicted aldo/keto reductase-like oxidoreductase
LIIYDLKTIACTKCRYCVDGCPQGIQIPDILALLNSKRVYGDWTTYGKYNQHIEANSKASDCISCGQCEGACPQGLNIIELLKEASSVFEKK